MKTIIYYLDKVLLLSEAKENAVQDNFKTFEFSANTKFEDIDNTINEWLSNNESYRFIFENADVLMSFLMMYLPNKFSLMYAAGGLIQKENNFLFIYKRGKWDLPKGKIDDGENAEQAAIRECEEETGISKLSIEKNLGITYHIFHQKNKWVLKITQWYWMKSSDDKTLLPQAEEGIEKVDWMNVDDIKSKIVPFTYLSINEVLQRAGVI